MSKERKIPYCWDKDFPYLGYFLRLFCKKHRVACRQISNEAKVGNTTYYKMLEGKDLRLDCYFRFLAACVDYCEDKDEFCLFLQNFCMRAIVEIRNDKGIELECWMKEVWEEMQMERKKMEEETRNISEKS